MFPLKHCCGSFVFQPLNLTVLLMPSCGKFLKFWNCSLLASRAMQLLSSWHYLYTKHSARQIQRESKLPRVTFLELSFIDEETEVVIDVTHLSLDSCRQSEDYKSSILTWKQPCDSLCIQPSLCSKLQLLPVLLVSNFTNEHQNIT